MLRERLIKFAKWSQKNFYNVFIVFLIVLNVLPFLAPLFLHWGWNLPAAIIYNIYSFFCHQFHYRSLHIYDHQCAWCTRDVFIWGTLLTIALIVKYRNVKGLRWYWMLPFMIPMGMDGGIQTIATILGFTSNEPVYMSNNFMRALTGSVFGTGLGLWMMPLFKDTVDVVKHKGRKLLNPFKVAVIVIVGAMLTYVLLVAIWAATSTNYPPTNTLDLEVKTPLKVGDWLTRRKNGI